MRFGAPANKADCRALGIRFHDALSAKELPRAPESRQGARANPSVNQARELTCWDHSRHLAGDGA